MAAGITASGCAQKPAPQAIVKVSYSAADRECLARAMYFESHRGSDDGMLAVGTVVANRVKSGVYGATFCEVVSQKRQFAPGVMTRTMDGDAGERARRTADVVLAGKRHAGVREAMFFHTAGLRFPYPNMHYVLVAGGNAFYEKRSVSTASGVRENARSRAMALAYAKADPTAAAKPIVVASLEPKAEARIAVPATVVAQPAPTLVSSQPAAAAISVASPPAPRVARRAVEEPAQTASISPSTPQAAPSKPARTISATVAPVLASSAPQATTPKTAPAVRPAPVAAFAPDEAPAAFPRSGGGQAVTTGSTPVSQAWAAFQ